MISFIVKVEVNFTARWWSLSIISVLLNLSKKRKSYGCYSCYLICYIVMLFPFSVWSWNDIISFVFEPMFLKWLECMEKAVQKTLFPFCLLISKWWGGESFFKKPSSLIDHIPFGYSFGFSIFKRPVILSSKKRVCWSFEGHLVNEYNEVPR